MKCYLRRKRRSSREKKKKWQKNRQCDEDDSRTNTKKIDQARKRKSAKEIAENENRNTCICNVQ